MDAPLLHTVLIVSPQGPGEGPPPTEQETNGGGGLFSLMPFILIGVVFWMLLIGPERKKRKQRDVMLGALQKDDKVMTTGGLYGQVKHIEDDVVTLQIADGVRVRFARQAIQGRADEGNKEQDAGRSGS